MWFFFKSKSHKLKLLTCHVHRNHPWAFLSNGISRFFIIICILIKQSALFQCIFSYSQYTRWHLSKTIKNSLPPRPRNPPRIGGPGFDDPFSIIDIYLFSISLAIYFRYEPINHNCKFSLRAACVCVLLFLIFFPRNFLRCTNCKFNGTLVRKRESTTNNEERKTSFQTFFDFLRKFNYILQNQATITTIIHMHFSLVSFCFVWLLYFLVCFLFLW